MEYNLYITLVQNSERLTDIDRRFYRKIPGYLRSRVLDYIDENMYNTTMNEDDRNMLYICKFIIDTQNLEAQSGNRKVVGYDRVNNKIFPLMNIQMTEE